MVNYTKKISDLLYTHDYLTTAEIAYALKISVYQARYHLLKEYRKGTISMKTTGRGGKVRWSKTIANSDK
ncbi:FaeA/PapI family transcriptional regulator [Yersinia pseudotuberculosis]|uniref:FaeA/PapI family transcriptional regulator n=1 Tax=Yersinia pseudotuberculosis TaxID=633 RepID=UPI0005DEB78E|nr:FaeA/PapI family transcriptional regulator [Yersinia pseudotuberculosis]CND29765.1 FaeA-like protein [Yersinia pseudotuberculosis]